MLRRILPTVGAALLVAGLASSPQSANAAPDTYVQPGEFLRVGEQACTMGFVFDGVGRTSGRVYVSTAAHCVEEAGVGASAAFWDGEVFGTVAAFGEGADDVTDWALIEVDGGYRDRVRAAVLGHEQYPKGVAKPADVRPGDVVQVSGNAMGMDALNVTREQRRAVAVFADSSRAGVVGPTWVGDSGGPLVHVPSGKALGIVSRACILEACSEVGPTVGNMVSAAGAKGLSLQLRTA